MRLTQIIQAAAALIAGLYVTFAQAHDARAGMLALLIMSIGWFAAAVVSVTRGRAVLINIVVGVGAAAMAWLSQSFEANATTTFAWELLGSWALFGTLAEVLLGLLHKPQRRDHFISAGLAALLFIALLAITSASDSVSRVGFFGAYAMLLAVHLGISAATPKANEAEAVPPAETKA